MARGKVTDLPGLAEGGVGGSALLGSMMGFGRQAPNDVLKQSSRLTPASVSLLRVL